MIDKVTFQSHSYPGLLSYLLQVNEVSFEVSKIGILGQVWYLIVSIPDLCTLTYFNETGKKK